MTYYVDANAKREGTGSRARPFRSMGEAHHTLGRFRFRGTFLIAERQLTKRRVQAHTRREGR